MSDREDELEPASGDEEMLADMVDRVACRLESGEPIDPGDDIPRHAAQASRLRSPLPTIRDLVDLGRSHAGCGISKDLDAEVIRATPPQSSA